MNFVFPAKNRASIGAVVYYKLFINENGIVEYITRTLIGGITKTFIPIVLINCKNI